MSVLPVPVQDAPGSTCRRRFLAAGVAALAAPTVVAQTSPAPGGPVTLVVPFTPGTGVDIVARQVAPHLARRLGRAVVVENKAGASGNIGAQDVVRANADGSTLLVSVNTLVMSRALYPKLPFDPLRDLEPITLASWGQLLLVASTASGIASAQELVGRARAKPGRLNYASPGAGTPHHLSMELLKTLNKVSITHIPYRGTAGAVTDLLGGQIDVMFLPIHVALPHVRAGTIKALGISSDKASPLLPNVAPLRGLDLGPLEVDMWYGLFAPRGTPKPILDRLHREFVEILALPEIAAAFETQGMTPSTNTPEEFKTLMARDAKRWEQVVKAQGITGE